MDKPLRILHLEDEPDFSALVSAFLEKERLAAELRLVTDFKGFSDALDADPYDIIISDYILPSCNGLQALELARDKCPEVPFLLLSGAIGERGAVEFLRGGATDYILKNGLERLVPAIRRAVSETREHKQLVRAESDASDSEKHYRHIFDGSPVPMWLSDLETKAFLEVNEAAIRHYGYSRDKFLTMSTKDICPPEEAARFARYLDEVVSRGAEAEIGHAGLWQHRKRLGALIDAEITWSIVNFKGRQALLTIANDVSEIRQASEALKKNESSLAAAQRMAHIGSWEMDLTDLEKLENNKLRWSDENYRIFGYEPRQMPITSEVFFNSIHPDDRQRVKDVLSRAFRSRQSYDAEYRARLPRGGERMVREHAEFAFDGQGKPVQLHGIVMDITQRKQLEEQLRQSQKLEAIGQLAGGVAHDFNNILTVTHGHALLLLGEKNLSKSGKESAQVIAQAAERAARLTRSLLAFSRRQEMERRRLDLNELINSMTMMLGRILGEDITLRLNCPPEPTVVDADPAMMEQVLLNLALNARDAMPKGGELTVEVSLVDGSTKPLAQPPEVRAEKYVCVRVADDGIGMSAEQLRHIFEPVYTTKETEKRIGLGLPTVYGIVKQHQGSIEAESEPEQGTTFRIYLPACTDQEGVAGKKSPKPPVRGGNETVLIVEDEAPVRELVSKVLTAYGYKILQAVSGANALEVWRRNKSKIDLLLTDIVLPDGLNGLEVAEKLRKTRSGLKIIFSSGYSAEALGKDFDLKKGQFFLQKPYDLQKLAATVRSCLDGR
jgi:PAS domain S-box-containing protein